MIGIKMSICIWSQAGLADVLKGSEDKGGLIAPEGPVQSPMPFITDWAESGPVAAQPSGSFPCQDGAPFSEHFLGCGVSVRSSPLFTHNFHLVVKGGYQICCVCYKLGVLWSEPQRFFTREGWKGAAWAVSDLGGELHSVEESPQNRLASVVSTSLDYEVFVSRVQKSPDLNKHCDWQMWSLGTKPIKNTLLSWCVNKANFKINLRTFHYILLYF